jgi:hypothetical protein
LKHVQEFRQEVEERLRRVSPNAFQTTVDT